MDGIMGSLLLDEIDYKATADNVDAFFKKRVPRLQQMANDDDLLHISSPAMNLAVPANHDSRNHATDPIDRVMQADFVCRKIAETIKRCKDKSQFILIEKYVKGRQDMWINEDLHCSGTKYSELKKWAQNEFADRFQSTKCWDDLHVYL